MADESLRYPQVSFSAESNHTFAMNEERICAAKLKLGSDA